MEPFRRRLFRFVVRRFGVLRNQWWLTQLFDIILGWVTAVTAPGVSTTIARLSRSLLEWPGVSKARHPLGGWQFDYKGVELGHIHSNGIADVRLSREEHADVLNRGMARPHLIVPASSWVTYLIDGPGDTDPVIRLFRIGYERLTTSAQLEAQPHSGEHP